MYYVGSEGIGPCPLFVVFFYKYVTVCRKINIEVNYCIVDL